MGRRELASEASISGRLFGFILLTFPSLLGDILAVPVIIE